MYIRLIFSLLLSGLMLAVMANIFTLQAAGSTHTGEVPVMLKTDIRVDGPDLRLGDLFDGLDRYQSRVVARAPAPGSTQVFGARRLLRLARTYGVDWRPASRYDRATITRSSRSVGVEQIRDLLRDARFMAGDGDDLVDILIEGVTARAHLPREATGPLAITEFSQDSMTGQFSAVLTTEGPEIPGGRLTLNGRFVTLVELPVAGRRIGAGQRLKARDLTIRRLPAEQVARDAVLDAGELIGMVARRSLESGKPIALGSVEPPILVPRNSGVVISLTLPNMTLTAQGRALESGARGDMIRVRNSHSRMTVDAIVTGPGRVTVQTPHLQAPAAADSGQLALN